MLWIDFSVCLFLGCFGVHKFRENNPKMGILYLFTVGLFGIGWIYDCAKYLIAAINGGQITSGPQLDENAPLPVVTSGNVPMTAGEVCHYCAPATFIKTKNVVVGYSGGSSGVSIRVMKGLSYRVGASKATPIRGNVQEKTPGTLTITNKRVIFSASKGAFDKKITSISSITPHKDGVSFQFGEKQYPLLCNKPMYVYQIVARVINSAEI